MRFMNSIQVDVKRAALALALAGAAAASAQPGPGPGPGAGPAASAPRAGMGPHGGGMGPRWGSDYTPGWSLMTPQERQEHRDRMRSINSHDECKAYLEQHHQRMAARASERGARMPAQPRRDACASLKK